MSGDKISDITVARIARRAAVCAEVLALKARRLLADQSTDAFDDFLEAHRGMQEAITRNYIDIQVATGGNNNDDDR